MTCLINPKVVRQIKIHDDTYDELTRLGKKNETFDDVIRNELIPDGYELIQGEYVRKTFPLLSTDVEKYVERDVVQFFRGIGYEIRRVPRAKTRTVDYEHGDLGIEVTVFHDYLPRIDEMDLLLRRHAETNSRICAYMYMKGDQLTIEVLNEERMANNISMLCLRQHISCYKPKLIRKIRDKYMQCAGKQHKSCIIVMDFRLAPFDSLSIKREIKKILDSNGTEFPSLEGVLISIPKHPNSEMYDSPNYVFIKNEHCVVRHEILKMLNNFSLATTDKWITINHIFIRFSGPSTASIESPCMDCPDKAWMDLRGYPTM
jgi:predicted CopG family antitoxin